MIEKIEGKKNGYKVNKDSTSGDFKLILGTFLRERGKVNCIITNRVTYPRFSTPLLGHSIITINNKIGDDEFYINAVV
jgi:hypothetical protein